MPRSKILAFGLILAAIAAISFLLVSEDLPENAPVEQREQLDENPGSVPPHSTSPDVESKPPAREDLSEPSITIQVLNARTLEPVTGARVEVRRGNPKLAEPSLSLKSRKRGRTRHRRDRIRLSGLAHRMRLLAETIKTHTCNEDGRVTLERPDYGTYFWAGLDRAEGVAEFAKNESEITLLIEAPIRVRALDGQGMPLPPIRVEAQLRRQSRILGTYYAQDFTDETAVFRGLWQELRASGDFQESAMTGVRLEISGHLFKNPNFLSIRKAVPDPIILQEQPSASVTASLPWLDGAEVWFLRVSLHEQGMLSRNRNSALIGHAGTAPFHFDQVPLSRELRLEVRIGPRRIAEHIFDGPTSPGQELQIGFPRPFNLILLRALVDESVEQGGGGSPVAYFLHTAEREAIPIEVKRGGVLSLLVPLDEGIETKAQLRKTIGEDRFETEPFTLEIGPGGIHELGKIEFHEPARVIRARVVDASGEAIPHAHITVQERLGSQDPSRWSPPRTLELHPHPGTGITEIRGLSALRSVRINAVAEDGLRSPWMGLRPEDSEVTLRMRKH